MVLYFDVGLLFIVAELSKISSTKWLRKTFFLSKKTNEKQYISLTYFGDISNKIGRIITKYTDYSNSFKSYISFETILRNSNEKTESLYKSGVYRLKFV